MRLRGRPWSAAGRGGEGEGLDALVFAVAAIGVGVEVADKGALDGGAHAGRVRAKLWSRFGQGEGQLADAARLGEADGGSGGVADAVDGGLGLLAQADDQQPLGGQACGGVQQQGFVGAGLVFAAGQDGGRGGLDGWSAVSSTGSGLASGPLEVWVSAASDGQQFGFEIRGGEQRRVQCA